MKVCTSCKQQKQTFEFYKMTAAKDGLQHRCKACGYAFQKAYIKTERGAQNLRLALARSFQRRKSKINSRAKVLRRENPNFRLGNLVRTRVRDVIRRRYVGGIAVTEIGCDGDTLAAWIESQFQPGMNWENWGSVWEMDHREPLAKFDLTVDEQRLKASHYSNLRPLWRSENRPGPLR